jgi:hypothetical protein
LISTALYLAGFAALWLPLLLVEFHGNFQSYYRHFFGFFSAQSGWGSFKGPSFHVLPPELLNSRLGILWLFLALIVWGLYRLRKQTGEFIAWLLMLPAAWFAVAYGYFKNQGGGGLHYFFEFYAFAWIFVLHAACRGRRWGPLTQLVVFVVVILVLPVATLLDQHDLLFDTRSKARGFRQEVTRLTYGQRVFGEETHLFKQAYQGDVVDTGDTNAAIARTKYFGEAFTRTYKDYLKDLEANPPKFVIAGILDDTSTRLLSPTLQDLLQRRYTLRTIARGTAYATPGSQALFERND